MPENFSVFDGFEQNEFEKLTKCIKFTEKHFKAKEIIMNISEAQTAMFAETGILLSGAAYLARMGIDGEKNIIEYYEEGSVFGLPASPVGEVNSYYILARTDCRVLFAPFMDMTQCCENCCDEHVRLIRGLITKPLMKAHTHADILSRRSIRSKLLTYFQCMSDSTGSSEITVPLSLSELADYLAVNRSAMMREMKNMNDDGLISSNGRHITLIRTDKNV